MPTITYPGIGLGAARRSPGLNGLPEQVARSIVIGNGFGQTLWLGKRIDNTQGNPTAPSLRMDYPARHAIIVPVSSGSRTISVDVKYADDVSGFRPRLRVKANSDLGFSADVVSSASSGSGWTSISASFTASADGAVCVELEMPDTYSVNAYANWDNLTVT